MKPDMSVVQMPNMNRYKKEDDVTKNAERAMKKTPIVNTKNAFCFILIISYTGQILFIC
tara:strand:- start:241 stop:417 length:177 start_codon:yes stop_codon:yes gene_type:complete